MTKTTHTPGPWMVEDGEIVQCDPGDQAIASVLYSTEDDPEADANALLLAAAPDLLAACRTLADWMESHACVPPCLTDARQAIAKAEGK